MLLALSTCRNCQKEFVPWWNDQGETSPLCHRCAKEVIAMPSTEWNPHDTRPMHYQGDASCKTRELNRSYPHRESPPDCLP